MSAANIKAGIEISAEVKGEEVVAKLAKTIEEAGIDTAELTERGKELSQTFARLDKAAALAEQFKKLKTQTQEVAAELSRAQAQTASLAREMKANPSKELEKQFKAAAAEAGRLKRQKTELAEQTHNTRKALAEAGISTKKLAQEERRLAAESEKARQDLAALNEEAQKLKRLADAKIALGLHVDVQANKEMQRLNRSYAELKQNGSLTKRELKAATAAYERELRRLSQTMDGIPSKQTAISSSVAGMGRTMLAAAGVGGGIYAVNEGLRRIIDTTTEFAAIKSRMEYAFSGADGAAEQMEWVKGVAAELGLELKSAANGYAQLASATKNLNLSTEQTQQIFTGVASAVAGMGLSADEANGVFLALSQIAGKGKVSMEELRGQLGERLTPAMGIAAKSMGVTVAELEKMVEQGISAEKFLPKFGAALEGAFSETAAKNANTLNGQINLLKNRYNEFLLAVDKGGVGQAAAKVFQDIGAALEVAQKSLDDFLNSSDGTQLQAALQQAYELLKHIGHTAIGVFKTLYDGVGDISSALASGEQKVSLLQGALNGVSIAMAAIGDGVSAVRIAFDLFAGAAKDLLSMLAMGLSKLSFGDVAAGLEQMALDLNDSARKNYAAAEQQAQQFDSSLRRVLGNIAETGNAAGAAYQPAIEAAEKATQAAEKHAEALTAEQQAAAQAEQQFKKHRRRPQSWARI